MKFKAHYIDVPLPGLAEHSRKEKRYEISEIETKLKDCFPFAKFWGVDDLKNARIFVDQKFQIGCNVIIQKNKNQTMEEIIESVKKQINAHLDGKINNLNSLRKVWE